MADPWLTIIGMGEDGAEGLSQAALAALRGAEAIMGPPRHLSLLPDGLGAERIAWPAPFADGWPLLEGLRGRPSVVLASGDPFHFGAGTGIARRFAPEEWRAIPAPSAFALACAAMGWAAETTLQEGLHAAPFARLRPRLAPGARIIATLRDGDAVGDFCGWLSGEGFGASAITALQALGGKRETRRDGTAEGFDASGLAHPIMIAVQIAGTGAVIPRASGIPDALFETDGQITKRPVRALTLSALAPRYGEHLWDIGGGSGSIGIEWLLCDPSLSATAVEPRADRAARIRANAARFGVENRLTLVEGAAPAALTGLAPPQAVFVGGGLSPALLDALYALPAAPRLVANAVTLESERLLGEAHASRGGDLFRFDIAQAAPIGPRKGWKAAYPIVQWSVTL